MRDKKNRRRDAGATKGPRYPYHFADLVEST